MPIPEVLRLVLIERMQSGTPIGFSPWRDCDGTVWGRITALKQDQMLVEHISALGKVEGTEWYPFSRIGYFDFDEMYAARLLELCHFNPKLPDRRSWAKSASEKAALIIEAIYGGRVLTMKVRAEAYSFDVLPLEFSGGWLHFYEIDDLGRVTDQQCYRASAIVAIERPRAMSEAESWLAARRQEGTPV